MSWINCGISLKHLPIEDASVADLRLIRWPLGDLVEDCSARVRWCRSARKTLGYRLGEQLLSVVHYKQLEPSQGTPVAVELSVGVFRVVSGQTFFLFVCRAVSVARLSLYSDCVNLLVVVVECVSSFVGLFFLLRRQRNIISTHSLIKEMRWKLSKTWLCDWILSNVRVFEKNSSPQVYTLKKIELNWWINSCAAPLGQKRCLEGYEPASGKFWNLFLDRFFFWPKRCFQWEQFVIDLNFLSYFQLPFWGFYWIRFCFASLRLFFSVSCGFDVSLNLRTLLVDLPKASVCQGCRFFLSKTIFLSGTGTRVRSQPINGLFHLRFRDKVLPFNRLLTAF